MSEPAVAAGINPTRSRRDSEKVGKGERQDRRRRGQEQGRKKGRQGVVWHCSLRNHADDRVLSDVDWADVVTDLLHRTGIATRGDLGACRWIAIRHADDHVHLAVVLVRQDTGRRVHPFRDYLRARETCRAAEDRLGLIPTAPADRTAAPAPTRAEKEKATRTSNESTGVGMRAGEPARVWLRRQVRLAAVQARTPDEFFRRLADHGVRVRSRESPTGQLTGYAVAAPGDLDAAGQPVWFSGRQLANDLTLPRLQTRWAAAPPTSSIPPAPTELSQIGRAERDAALGEATTATRDAIHAVRVATAVGVGSGGGERMVADAVAHAAGDMLTATATVLTRGSTARGIAGRGSAVGDQARVGRQIHAAAEALDAAARDPGIGQPRTWPLLAVRLRRAGGRLAAVRTLGFRGGPDAQLAALGAALVVLMVEIAAYRRATKAMAQARAAGQSAELLQHAHRVLAPPEPVPVSGPAVELRSTAGATRSELPPPISPRLQPTVSTGRRRGR